MPIKLSKVLPIIILLFYILYLQRYDFGVSQHYEMESHGGTTFCAIATLQLSGQLNLLSNKVKDKLIRWLLFRQVCSANALNK